MTKSKKGTKWWVSSTRRAGLELFSSIQNYSAVYDWRMKIEVACRDERRHSRLLLLQLLLWFLFLLLFLSFPPIGVSWQHTFSRVRSCWTTVFPLLVVERCWRVQKILFKKSTKAQNGECHQKDKTLFYFFIIQIKK